MSLSTTVLNTIFRVGEVDLVVAQKTRMYRTVNLLSQFPIDQILQSDIT